MVSFRRSRCRNGLLAEVSSILYAVRGGCVDVLHKEIDPLYVMPWRDVMRTRRSEVWSTVIGN
jgi:hypothetical protein